MQRSRRGEGEAHRTGTGELNDREFNAFIEYLRHQRDSETLKAKKASKQESHRDDSAAACERDARTKPPRRTRNTLG